MNIDDGVCAYLTGGLGNQMFVLAAAWEQAERLNCPLYIDASKYVKGDLRSFELGSLALPGEVVSDESPWLDLGRRSKRLGLSARTRKLRVYREESFGYSAKINKIVPGTTIFGYFQSPQYFSGIADRMADLILSSPATVAEQSVMEALVNNGRATVHVRRGDYMTSHTQAVHGLTSSDYFERGLGLIRKISSVDKATAFSDEPKVAQNELGYLPNVNIFMKNSELSSLNTIKAMSMGSGMVMSNSSFSWWAAWLMARRGPHTIIAPRPWMSSGESAADLLGADWLTLDARGA
ncbi:alpha-1,2-fucosyltransferase [Arthrobacter sp. Soil762]|uniref:alpha-1,2-fucosyltransferase n=1 Tax=Arthrobacter sp. Soil762 TaxID=1736401 RepID=UPI0009EA940C|nr:alpha-1,2-fucosyltransferase [Arthrobacter sp. Soil762]